MEAERASHMTGSSPKVSRISDTMVNPGYVVWLVRSGGCKAEGGRARGDVCRAGQVFRVKLTSLERNGCESKEIDRKINI